MDGYTLSIEVEFNKEDAAKIDRAASIMGMSDDLAGAVEFLALETIMELERRGAP